MLRYSFIFLTGLILVVLFASCGGGGGTTVVPVSVTATPLPTQIPTGSIYGKVFESDGVTPIENAFLALYTSSVLRSELSGQATPYRTMTTASDGSYLFTDIPQGNIRIEMWRNQGEYTANPNNPSGAVNGITGNINLNIINNIIPTPVPPTPSGNTPTTIPGNTPTNTPIAPTPTNTPGGSAPTATNTPAGPTPLAGGLVGRVYDLFTNTAMEDVNLSVNGKTGTTDINGYYTITSVGSGTQRMTASGNIITRSFPVNLSGGQQDISVLPSNFNTTMFRALTVWPGSHTGTARWEIKPKFIIYKYMQDVDNVAVPQTTIDKLTSVIQEVGGLADGFFSSPEIEYYNGRANDDTRWKFSTSPPEWGYIQSGYNAIGISMRQTLPDNNTGLGGGTWDGDLWLRGGGVVLSAEYQNDTGFTSTVRHEIGHALALWHPFENLAVSNSQMEYSIMNYWPQGSLYGKRSEDYSDADKKAFIIMYHRAPDNNAPDTDPDNFNGYHKNSDKLYEFVSE